MVNQRFTLISISLLVYTDCFHGHKIRAIEEEKVCSKYGDFMEQKMGVEHFKGLLNSYPDLNETVTTLGDLDNVTEAGLCIPNEQAFSDNIEALIQAIQRGKVQDIFVLHLNTNSSLIPQACNCIPDSDGCIITGSNNVTVSYCIGSKLIIPEEVPLLTSLNGCSYSDTRPGSHIFSLTDSECERIDECVIDGSMTLDETTDFNCLTVIKGNVTVTPGYKGYISGQGDYLDSMRSGDGFRQCVINVEEGTSLTGIENSGCEINIAKGEVGKLKIDGGLTSADSLKILDNNLAMNGGSANLNLDNDLTQLSLNSGYLELNSEKNIAGIAVNGGQLILGGPPQSITNLFVNGGITNVTSSTQIQSLQLNRGEVIINSETEIVSYKNNAGICTGCVVVEEEEPEIQVVIEDPEEIEGDSAEISLDDSDTDAGETNGDTFDNTENGTEEDNDNVGDDTDFAFGDADIGGFFDKFLNEDESSN